MSHFSQLLEMSTQQAEAQRLLFLFASTEVSKKSRKQDEKRGTIEPVMCVAKLPEELTDFKALSEEANQMSKDWDLLFVASLAGTKTAAPSEDEAEPFLNKMTSDIKTGQDLSQYLVFDRQENPIVINAS